MAVELEQIRETMEKVPTVTVMVEQPVKDNWDQAFFELKHGDFSGLSTAIVVVLCLIFLRPLVTIAAYVGAFLLILMAVKYLAV